MHFENQHLYHIYNQGYNQRKIFFCRDNYLFFFKKGTFTITTLLRCFGLLLNAKPFSFYGSGE